MDRNQVASSNIRSIGYDMQTQTLEVEFLSGWVYQYYGVPEFLHQQNYASVIERTIPQPVHEECLSVFASWVTGYIPCNQVVP